MYDLPSYHHDHGAAMTEIGTLAGQLAYVVQLAQSQYHGPIGAYVELQILAEVAPERESVQRALTTLAAHSV